MANTDTETSETRRGATQRRATLIPLLKRENIKGDDIVWLHELSAGCTVQKGNVMLYFNIYRDFVYLYVSDFASGDVLFHTRISEKGTYEDFFHVTMEYIRSTFLEKRDADEAGAGGAGSTGDGKESV